uniref:Folate-biopterin transporter 3 n=1 Tax=Fagus sylvatica TaxID=28930 RepID=A0A2N9IW86_FAGSY
MLVLSLQKKLHLAFALLSLMAGSAGIAIADVTIDACVTHNSINHPSLASDMQSLCGMSSSIGALGVFGLLSIPPGLVILVGILLREPPVHNFAYRRVGENLLDASKTMWTTLKCRDVWRPCLYMYLSLALGLNIYEGMFYWYTDAKGGPYFSQFQIYICQEPLGSVALLGSPHRGELKLESWGHGLLDLVLVLRINLKIGVPDYFFVVMDAAISHIIGRLKWMPLLVLSSKLCPPGIEGTFFALIMAIDHVGMLTSTWAGGLLLHVLRVTRTQFDNLWMAILIRSFLRLVPIGLLFLIPRSDPNSSILPTELLRTKKGDGILEPETVEMVSLINST